MGTKRIAVVASRKFHPGHFSHLAATCRLLDDSGVDAYMLVHPAYRQLNPGGTDRMLSTWAELRRLGRIDLLIVWFPSVRALLDIALARILRRTRVVYVLHEPFESFMSYFNAGFGAWKTLRVCIVSVISLLIVMLSTRIALPSAKAVAGFESKYRWTGKRYAWVPLLFDDEAAGWDRGGRHSDISYIGTIAEDHAFAEFLAFAGHSIANDLHPGFRFLIATRSSLSDADRATVAPWIASGRLRVQEGRPLDNREINECYAGSLVVWNAYKRSMQSGVLPKAYMFGIPLLVSASNGSEFFTDRQNGVLIGADYDMNEIHRAIDDIAGNFEVYSMSCRRRFLDVFYYKARSKPFIDFISG
jgi:hypothetical protein